MHEAAPQSAFLFKKSYLPLILCIVLLCMRQPAAAQRNRTYGHLQIMRLRVTTSHIFTKAALNCRSHLPVILILQSPLNHPIPVNPRSFSNFRCSPNSKVDNFRSFSVLKQAAKLRGRRTLTVPHDACNVTAACRWLGDSVDSRGFH